MKFLLVMALGLAAVAASPYKERIVGGSITDISQYPFAVRMLRSWDGGITFGQACGSAIINNRSLLTAAHCFIFTQAAIWRARVGSTYGSSGGIVHTVQSFFVHPHYNKFNLDNDVAVLRIAGAFSFNQNVQPGAIAGPDYNLPDNTPVWAIGWGAIYFGGPPSEELRHVQVWTVNQEICRTRYAGLNFTVTENMLCSGWLDVGGRDQCTGDSGSPLLHNKNVIIGVSSWGEECASPRYPGVNVRVSRFTSWIQSVA